MPNHPTPENEMDRLLSLSDFDLDYADHKDSFKDLAKLAAKVAGTEISLVNLIDSFTQWTISGVGLEVDQFERDESVCQYTIAENESFEVEDLRADDRFKDRFYVKDDPSLRYYFGVPLRVDDAYNIGALCVLDKDVKHLTPEKIELLKIIAAEIVSRLKDLKTIDGLKVKLSEVNETQKKVVHDIRGPISGIVGLASLITEQGKNNQMDEMLEIIGMIQQSGRSILDLADEILGIEARNKKPELNPNEFNLLVFKEKLERLYVPQARNKKIQLIITTYPDSEQIPFSKNKLLQIVGNLISNAIKFTPDDGKVETDLNFQIEEEGSVLQIQVRDNGVGLDDEGINKILNGKATSTDGTTGEVGYGFGLALVKHLIDSLKGSLNIYSKPGEGTVFEVRLPQGK